MDRYYDVLKTVYEHYLPYLEKDEYGLNLIDPVDEKVIGFHYGETHLGGAFIIGGIKYEVPEMVETGISILESFIAHAHEYQQHAAYHWDFNNFALCAVYEYLEKTEKFSELRDKIRTFVLLQQDSNNATINWIPMRIFVNEWKFKWTKDESYKSKIDYLEKQIGKAQYADGFIEDLLPKGTSFNFQYHIFTTAMLTFLKVRGINIANVDLAISRSNDIIDSEGDINYLGRGNNQIFAWGPTIYLYTTTNTPIVEKAWSYIQQRSLIAIRNDNIILNEFMGNDKIWWWDYHFCSVYIAHYVFWLMLTATEEKKMKWEYLKVDNHDSGIHIYNGNNFIVTFDGRKHYLAEKGKVISNICHNGKSFFKGAFGPYYKEYGFKYSSPTDSLHNFVGLLQTSKILGVNTEKALFPKQIFVEGEKAILIYKKDTEGIVNVAWFNETPPLVTDGEKPIQLRENGLFRGPYGWVHLFQSKIIRTDKIEIMIGE